jgi:hypothetical protein
MEENKEKVIENKLPEKRKINVAQLISENSETKGDIAKFMTIIQMLLKTLDISVDEFKDVKGVSEALPIIMKKFSKLMIPGQFDMGAMNAQLQELIPLFEKYKTLLNE